MISPDVIQQPYQKWQELLNRDEGEAIKKIVCIDGKTMRSNKRKDGKPSHIVSAWSREDGFCLGQKAVEEKSNEITAIPQVLEKIRIKGQVVTIDAMGTQMAQNLDIIRKWSLSILKMIELFRPNISMKKKRFIISMNPAEFLEQVLNF